MPQVRRVISAIMLFSTLALSGCGSSGSSSTGPPVASVSFKSPKITGTSIPALYTCNGKNIAPPLEWGSVPATTGKLALFVVGVTSESTTNTYKITVEWAVAGIDPRLHKMVAGHLPKGAYAGLNSSGKRRYSICPQRGEREKYIYELYGLPASVVIPRNFVGSRLFAALNPSGQVSPANAHGAFAAVYKRS